MNIASYIGLRFSFSEKGSAFLSFITRVSMVGLSLGVMALVVVVSVMNGFDSQLKYRILGAFPHMIVQGPLPENIEEIAGVIATAPFLKREGILIQSGKNRLVAIYGITPEKEAEISVIPDHIVQGELSDLLPGSNKIIIGQALARQLALLPGDSVSMLIPEPSKRGNSVVPRIARVELGGVFQLQSELDYTLVLIHLDDLKRITGSNSSFHRVTLSDIFLVNQVKHLLGPQVKVSDWTQEYGDFFETVRMEKLMMFILLTLIVAIAAFNTVSGLSMMVKEKQAEIAVLRTMGLARTRVMGIFIVQGSFIGLVGTLMGVALGVPLAYNITQVVGFFEDLTGSRMLAGTYFDRVPSDVRMEDIVIIVCVSLIISMVATLYPAYRAARIEPASVLRAE